MNWEDEGIFVSSVECGENGRVARVLTKDHGLCSGFLKRGRTLPAQPGDYVNVRWNARLSEHLGFYNIEQKLPLSLAAFRNRTSLFAVNSFRSLIESFIPERYPYPLIYKKSLDFLIEAQCGEYPIWSKEYVLWEIILLKELGFGLELNSCVVTGQKHDLIYLSPKSGQAVSRNAGENYKHLLFILPEIFIDNNSWNDKTMLEPSLKITGYFLEKRVAHNLSRKIPQVRHKMADDLIKKVKKNNYEVLKSGMI